MQKLMKTTQAQTKVPRKKQNKENKLSRDIPQRIIHVTCQVIIYIFLQVFKKWPSTPSGYLYDFCDGETFKQHPLFGTKNDALQIVIYYDEVETANPFGSYHGKHK